MAETKKELNPAFKAQMFNSETAREAGRKGGSVKSYRKTLAVRLNALKTGKYAKHRETVEALYPTQDEKLSGWAFEDKIKSAKQLSAVAGANNVLQMKEAWALELTELKALIRAWELFYEKTGKTPPPGYRLKYLERVEEYAKNVWGINSSKNNVLIQTNTTTNVDAKIDFTDVLTKVLGDPDGE